MMPAQNQVAGEVLSGNLTGTRTLFRTVMPGRFMSPDPGWFLAADPVLGRLA
jgi:hypothetical protein